MVLRVSAHVGQEQKGGTVTSVLRDSGTTLLLGVKPVSVKMMEPLPVTESPADANVSQG